MPTHPPAARLTGLVVTALAVCASAGAQTAADFTDGTVFDSRGVVIINHGATSVTASRGVVVRRGDRVMVPDAGVLTIRCPDADAMRIDTPGTFTFSGCQPAAAVAAAPTVEPVAAAPEVAAAPAAPAPVPSSRPRMGGGGTTLGIIGGLALLGAAAGGGGGGGSSGSTSPPVSP